jgi:hypothetical protein
MRRAFCGGEDAEPVAVSGSNPAGDNCTRWPIPSRHNLVRDVPTFLLAVVMDRERRNPRRGRGSRSAGAH